MNGKTRIRYALVSLACGLAVAARAGADSDEAAIVRAPLPADVRPLLALILDTSPPAMSPLLTREAYDGERDYGDALPADHRCDPGLVFFRRGAGPAPDCSRQVGLAPYAGGRGFQCEAARAALGVAGFYIASRAAQWRPGATGGDWSAPHPLRSDAVECRADDPAAIAWDRAPLADPYIFYTGNYLNWLRGSQPIVERPMAAYAIASMSTALRATDELDVAWLRIATSTTDGGYVAGAPMPAAQAADRLLAIATEPDAPGAPLAETLVESALWLSGGTAQFGAVDSADRNAFDPAVPARYLSPFTAACRPVTLGYLTAGQVSDDEEAGAAAGALPGFLGLTGGCSGDCLAQVSRWLGEVDIGSDLPGSQSAAMRFVTVAPAPALLVAAAPTGVLGQLADPLEYINLAARSLQRDAAIPAQPQLSAAAVLPPANPADAADVVFGLSAPRGSQRWHGNVFRYALRAAESPLEPPTVAGRDGEDAMAANGLPSPSSRSAWSDSPDANLLAGGAAGRLPVAGARAIYSEFGERMLTAAANRLRADNPSIEASMLGLVPDDEEPVVDLLDWLAGRGSIGDPGLHAPVIARYPDAGLEVVYVATHDGLLHAFDASSGIERWAWMPGPLLPRLASLMRNEPTTVRDHGIDGPLVLHRYDPDGNGRIDAVAGEHLWLLFGLGRGGGRYYAIDVARADAPQLMWSLDLPGSGSLESRAEPVVTRIEVDGAEQNAGRWVVLLSGGYDRRYDSAAPTGVESSAALHLVDAETGTGLWSAGNVPDADLLIGDYEASQPSAPRALDLDGDGHLDRAYLLDVSGGLWRFDFAGGRAAGELAEVARLAQLGTGPQRFHATPDVSLAYFAGGTRFAIATGSGWLARPLDDAIIDRVYTVFDQAPLGATRAWLETDLHDADEGSAPLPESAPGWFRRLDTHGAGEKVVGSTVTFDHVLRFQTWQPLPPEPAAPCGPARAVRRLYAFDVRNGLSHTVATDSPEDDAIELAGAGLPVALRFGFPGAARCAGCRPRVFGIVGAETFDAGYAGDPVRTSWRKLAPPPASR